MLLSAERTYDEIDLATAEQLARCIAMAVDNVHMFRKMQSSQAQLVQAAKLAALGVIAAGIAHEINNPLTIIKGQLKCFEMFLEKNESHSKDPGQDQFSGQFKEQFRSCAEKMNKNIERIVKIVGHVKDFSRQSERKFSTLELQGLIESSLTLFEQQFYLNGIEIHKNFPDKALLVTGDFSRLEQVLVNILGNAKDAIKARLRKPGGSIAIHLEASKGTARIAISDDGIGINPALKECVFEPFFTTKDVGQGTGLGLSISHGIIKDHHGSIEFISEQDKGTTVAIQLPIHPSTSGINLEK
jgi:C4-dicarboxylate-specific signal transduction histidine kinase